MKNDASFWAAEGSHDMYRMENAEKEILHPYTASLVHSFAPGTVLDYGCGNGVLATLLDTHIEVSLFDKEATTLSQIVEALDMPNVFGIEQETQIPMSFFDVIVLSQVLMCIPTLEEIKELAGKLRTYLKQNGSLVVVVTHPCFLQYQYGHWHSSYSIDQPFNYLRAGEPYTVYMKRKSKSPLTFTDYNWPLHTIMNTFLEAGYCFKQMTEHRDMQYDKEWAPNTDYPHYMFLIFN